MSELQPECNRQQTENEHRSKLYALLIGIDHYSPNRVPSGRYGSLNGCVRDVERVEAYLDETFGADCRISKLTSRIGIGHDPRLLPTYENIVTAMKELAQKAEKGSRVLIHYSGHGGRAITKYPEAKGGKDRLDEALVPMDIGYCEDRYVRDIELAYLISDLVKRGLKVTLVLDCCHSGGATRSISLAAPRGIGIVDTLPRAELNMVAPHEQLVANWKGLRTRTTRDVTASTGWLPEPKGYVLLTACRQQEVAWESSSEHLPPGGVFTHWLLDSLRHLGPETTFWQLHDRTLAKVRGEYPSQSPQLEGEEGWDLLGGMESERSWPSWNRKRSINVLSVDHEQRRVQVATGTVHGVQRGAQLAIYPARKLLGSDKISVPDSAIHSTVVDIDWPGTTSSWAELPDQTDSSVINEGDQAVLLSTASLRLQGRVQLLSSWQARPAQDALELVRKSIAEADSGFLELVSEDAVTDLQVAVIGVAPQQLQYEIRDRGGVVLENLVPALSVGEKNAGRLVKRLIHLVKYKHVRQLSTTDDSSALQGMLRLELCRWPDGCGDKERPQEHLPLLSPGGTPQVAIGDRLCLWVTNTSAWPVEVTMLDLQPDWGISQIYPRWRDGLTFDPGWEEPILLVAGLPDGIQRGTDVLKVFATRETTSYHWLELPPLNRSAVRRSLDRSPHNRLEQLQRALAVDQPATRNMSYASRSEPEPEPEWEVTSLEVTVVRPPTQQTS